MKRLRLLLIFGLLFVAGGLKAQTLVLHHADGTTTDVELFTQPNVKFKGDQLLITSPVLDMEYSKEDVVRFTYKVGTPTVIETLSDGKDYSKDNGQLVFHGIKPTDPIAVYTTGGIRVPVSFNRKGTDVSINLSKLPKGVYLLNVNGKSSKFTRP